MAKKRQNKHFEKQNQNIIDAGLAETEIFVPDPEVAEEFIKAQRLGRYGRTPLINEMLDQKAGSKVLSGGDIDAGGDLEDSGEESVGGSAPTPDQDNVELLGRAVGINYEDNEPLRVEDKVNERDRHRWELDPASSEGFRKRSKNEGDYEGD